MTTEIKSMQTWKSVELLIAFHKNKARQSRDEPYLWSPKNAWAKLFHRPKEQEAFVVVKSETSDDDIQIKFHPDKIVARRDHPLGWSGVVLEDHQVSVKVDEVWITIKSDGSVTKRDRAETTHLEADGSIMKISPGAEILVSGDGESVSRRTADQIDAFTSDGFVSKRR